MAMANLLSSSSSSSSSLQFVTAQPFNSSSNVLRRRRKSFHIQCVSQNQVEIQSSSKELKRRDVLFSFFMSSVSFPSLTNAAFAIDADVQESFRMYEDEKNKFQISVPKDWLMGSSETDVLRSVTAFYPRENSGSNGLGPDFTKLGSFGTADEFAEYLVTGMDRSWKNPPGVAAKLINAKSAKGLYYIEYTLQNPGERRKHIISAVGIGSGTWYNRLYTVNGQFMEDESDKYRSKIEKSVLSFRLL